MHTPGAAEHMVCFDFLLDADVALRQPVCTPPLQFQWRSGCIQLLSVVPIWCLLAAN